MRATEPKKFFSEEEQQKIAEAIAAAEQETTGEICVRIERQCPGDPLKHAGRLLHSLGFSSTTARTAVLIYISIEDRKVAIYGDRAIHEKIGDGGWNEIRNLLVMHFGKEQFIEGVCRAVSQVGAVLKKHFPAGPRNPNELPDKPSLKL